MSIREALCHLPFQEHASRLNLFGVFQYIMSVDMEGEDVTRYDGELVARRGGSRIGESAFLSFAPPSAVYVSVHPLLPFSVISLLPSQPLPLSIILASCAMIASFCYYALFPLGAIFPTSTISHFVIQFCLCRLNPDGPATLTTLVSLLPPVGP